MARILITGSSDGIGLRAACTLISQGHQVTLHARNASRAADTKAAAPGAACVLVGDLSTLAGMKALAADADRRAEPFDVVVHNAGLGYDAPLTLTPDGLPLVFAVNSLAPYVLTALMRPPGTLVYTSSGLHASGDGSLEDVTWKTKRWNGMQAYSDSKLHNAILACAVARRWPHVASNAIDPGWVATKMGGRSAPGSVHDGADTLIWAAGGSAHGTAQLFKARRAIRAHAAASSEVAQDELLRLYEQLSGVRLPVPRQ